MNDHTKKVLVKFYFVSGLSINCEYSQDKWKEVLNSLSRGWHTLTSMGEEFGMNFSHITHYEKIKDE